MEMNEYIVTCRSHKELQSLYNDMETEGGTLYIPNREIELLNRREVSRNTHYKLTAEEAELISNDKRVIACELSPDVRDDVTVEIEGYHNNEVYGVGVEFTKGYASTSTSRKNDRQWGHIHSAGTTAQRAKGTFGTNGTSNIAGPDTVEIFNNGRHVDVVIIDGECAFDSDEWRSLSDPAKNRFVSYDWFAEHPNVGYSGNYGYPSMAGGATGAHDHGMHVGGTVAGQYYGWANEANIYGLNAFGNYSVLALFDWIREFHKNKPINPATGRRNPTITNNSWGYGINADWSIGNVTSITYRGTTYNSSNPGPSGWSMAGILKDFGIKSARWPLRVASLDADIEDAINEGIVVVAAAGNSNWYMVREGHPDYNNYCTISGVGTNEYMHRGASPGAAKGVICVGAMNADKDFRRATFTNYGDRIDIFAPGTNILSIGGDGAYGGTSSLKGPIDRPEYPNLWDNMLTFSGTSMASPQVCGILACIASGRERFTNDDAIAFVRQMSLDGDMTFDVGAGYGTIYSTYYANIDEANTNTQNYTFLSTSNDKNGNVAGQDPTFTIDPGDTIRFEIPQGQLFVGIMNASTSQGYEMDVNGATSWNPTLTLNVGDILGMEPAINMPSHPIYIRDSNGNNISGVTNNGASQQGQYLEWDTTGATPGTYKYQCGAHPGMQGTIQVTAAPAWNHPMYIRDANGNNVTTGTITNMPLTGRGWDNAMSWTTDQNHINQTFYYECGNHSQMRGQIVVNNAAYQTPGGHDDNTCQQGSPNSEIRCKNTRPETGYISGFKQSTLNNRRRTDREDNNVNANRQLYPRVNGLYKT